MHFKLYDDLVNAVFIERKNRFIAIVRINDKEIEVHVPSTGKMAELLQKGTRVVLSPAKNINRKTKYSLIGVYRKNILRLIDSLAANKIFEKLFNEVDEFKEWSIEKTEYTHANSRFDFLITNGKEKGIVELKTCTLIENNIASFPDAVSERAVKHVNELIALSEKGYKTYVVFLVSGKAKYFIPNYHVDLKFYEAFMQAVQKINVLALSYDINENFEISGRIKNVPVPIDYLKKIDIHNVVYIVTYYLETEININFKLKTGYYVYIGRELNNKKFKKMRKLKTYTFIDIALANELREKLNSMFEEVPYINSSNNNDKRHLFYSHDEPESLKEFIDTVYDFRFKGVF